MKQTISNISKAIIEIVVQKTRKHSNKGSGKGGNNEKKHQKGGRDSMRKKEGFKILIKLE